ncbi:MAG: DUF433 domain-containing protein [Armatimonadetes bacterium]|nr:DUF433 domain-containing protein [Armatimonadota bacterium]
MDWHDRIAVDPRILVGKPVVKGTRIAVVGQFAYGQQESRGIGSE